jgi:hypothetical protein
MLVGKKNETSPQELQRLRLSLGEVSDSCLPEAGVHNAGVRSEHRSFIQVQGNSGKSREMS